MSALGSTTHGRLRIQAAGHPFLVLPALKQVSQKKHKLWNLRMEFCLVSNQGVIQIISERILLAYLFLDAAV